MWHVEKGGTAGVALEGEREFSKIFSPIPDWLLLR